MTNQPTREALVEAIKAAIVAQHDPAYSYVSKVSVGDVELDGSFEIEPIADAALSILSTALAERDAKIAELEEQAWQLKADAYRYRWLRERDLDTIHQGGVFAGSTPRNVVINGEDLDWAVDEARGIEAEARAKLKESSRG